MNILNQIQLSNHSILTTHISGPAAYSLPPMLAHNILVKSTAPSFSMYGRIKTGSFHEGMKKVLLECVSFVRSFVHQVVNHWFLCFAITCLFSLSSPGSWPCGLQSCGPNYLFEKGSVVQHDRPKLPARWIYTEPRTRCSLSWKGAFFENWSPRHFHWFIYFFQLSHFLLSYLSTSSSGDDDEGPVSNLHVWHTPHTIPLSRSIMYHLS